MKTQNIKFWFLLALAAVFVWSCEDKDYEIPGPEPTNSYVTTSFGDLAARLQVNGTMAFIDFSRGITSREWIFPDGIAVDENEMPLTTTTEANFNAKFTKFGEFEIVCKQKFADTVWVGSQKTQSLEYDTTFIITVLDSVRVNFSAANKKNGAALTIENGAKNEVIAGNEVTFMSDCTGDPSTFEWTLSRADGFNKMYEGDTTDIKFSGVGVYDLNFFASNEFGEASLTIKDFIEVVASTEPVDLLNFEARPESTEKLALIFSRDMQLPNKVDAFSLAVKNGEKEIDIKIASVELDAIEKNILWLNLSERMYNTDAITVSYDKAAGDLITTDGMLSESFANIALDKNKITSNMLPGMAFDESIENSTNADFTFPDWGGAWVKYNMGNIVSTTRARTGTKSLYINMEAGGGAVIQHKPIPVKSGFIYEIGMWVYVEEMADANADFLFMEGDSWSGGGAYFTPDFPVGEWTYISSNWTSNQDGEYDFIIRGNNQGSTIPFKFYVDDIKFVELESRP